MPQKPNSWPRRLRAYRHALCQPSQLNLVSRRRDLHGQAQPLSSYPPATFTFNAPCSIGLRPVRQARPACDALNMIYVRQTGNMRPASFRFHLAVDTPGVRYQILPQRSAKRTLLKNGTQPLQQQTIVLIGVDGTSARRVGGDASFGREQRPASKVVAPTLSG